MGVALDTKPFTGAAALREQRDAGDFSRLVPFTISGRGIPRPGMAVIDGGKSPAGRCRRRSRSASEWPTCRTSTAVGSEIVIDVRGRQVPAVVAKKPLYRKEI